MWSAGYQPSGVEPDCYEVAFSEDRAEIARRDGTLTTTLEVAVSPEDDAEVRRVSLTNLGTADARDRADVVRRARARRRTPPTRRTRRSRSSSCETEFVAERRRAARRRGGRASADEPQIWAAHLAAVEGDERRRRAVRDRSRALPRARPTASGRRSR